MNCEIEFLPVGENSRPGDAIVVRYGDPSSYELMVVDGGTQDAGEALVRHLGHHFPGQRISHVVLTHPDSDHACGLRQVLSECAVDNLWLHVPSLSASSSLPYFADKTLTAETLARKLYREYDVVTELAETALKRGVKINSPFAGQRVGPFIVLSPYRDVYDLLLPQFSRTPDPDEEAIKRYDWWIGKQPTGLLRAIYESAKAKVQDWIDDTWHGEMLRDGGITSASNESSVILYGDFGPSKKVLLTGDAGLRGLSMAAHFAEHNALPLRDFQFVQIPHHGSRRNVGPTILNRLIGSIQPEGAEPRFSAYVSAPKDDSSHPRKMVLNAFIRRGARVSVTQGSKIIYYGGFPKRDGYQSIERIAFAPKVENYDS